MIIAETFNNDYDGEESYDYLFKFKTKEERQQRKEERKQKKAEKKQQKQDPASETKGKRPLLGNFGLFNKNKKKTATGTSGSSSGRSATKESGNSEPLTAAEIRQTSEAKTTTAGATLTAAKDASEQDNTESESAALESEILKKKEFNKAEEPKESSYGPMLGFAFLSFTLLIVGVALFKADKKSNAVAQPLKTAA